jgi:inner membrane transporter RhtA
LQLTKPGRWASIPAGADEEAQMQPTIACPSAGLGPQSDVQTAATGPAAASSAAVLATGLDRMPPTVLLLLAVVAVQLGGALASVVFSSLGPVGITFASALFSAVLLTLFGRPQSLLRGSRALLRRHAGLILGYGVVNLALALPYYLALERVPLGILATITFLGPLGLAVVTSRRLVHFLWIGIAAVGVLLLAPDIRLSGGAEGLDPIGLAEAAVAGLGWAAFVLMSKKAGAVFPGTDGLALALWVCAAMCLPLALLEGSIQRTGIAGIAGALGVSLLGVVLPLVLEFRALQRMSARTYGILVTLEPAVGALVGVILLSQPAGPRMVVAVTCVTLAALGVTLSDRRERP